MEELSSAQVKVSQFLDQGLGMVMNYAPKVLLAIVTLLIGLWLIKRLVAVIDRQLGAKDPTLNSFLCGLISITLKIIVNHAKIN